MHSAPVLLRLILSLFTLASLTAAWPGWLPDLDALVVRDDSSNSQPSSASQTDSSSPSQPTDGTNSAGPSETNHNSAGPMTTAKPGNTHKGNVQPTSTKHKTFPINDPPGGVSLQVPAALVTPTPLYMIGDNVTFSWNYTSLQAKPSAIDVLITCSINQETWTLTSNMTFQTDVAFVWNSADTEDNPGSPLLTELYDLIVKDTNVDVTDTPEPGYLGSWSGLSFGMYANQKYVPFDEWTCPGSCSAASGAAPTALGLLLPMAIITICSFTWFVTGLGIN